MISNMKAKCLSLGIALLCLGWNIGSADAYNRDTHQHITEIAYAYLKLMDLCEPTEAIDTTECESQCIADFKAIAEPITTYTCECLKDACETYKASPISETCGDITDGFEKYECVESCSETDAAAVECRKDADACPAPFYADYIVNDRIFESSCRKSCVGATTLKSPDKCEPISGVFESPYISFAAAGETVDYFQNFKASPCPGRAYSYHGMNQCDSSPASAAELNLLDEVMVPAYEVRGDLHSEKKALKDWREAAGENFRFGKEARRHYWLTKERELGVNLKNQEFRSEYNPVIGTMFNLVQNLSEPDDETQVDYTGSILGFHAGVVDQLDDIHFSTRFLPAFETLIKEISQGAVGAGTIIYGALVGITGILACGLSCPVTAFFGECDDCFDEVFSSIGDILEAGQKAANDIEETTWFSTQPSTTFGEHNATSMLHFMNLSVPTNPAFGGMYDDIDGFKPATAFGPVGNTLTGIYDAAQLDHTYPCRQPCQRSRISPRSRKLSNQEFG